MSTHANMVKMTVTSVASAGVGTITLNAASSGFQSFGTAFGADATVDILITEGTAWEVARNCTYTHSGTTVTRGTLESSSTGSAVAFTSAAVVSVVATADLGNSIETALAGHIAGLQLSWNSATSITVGTGAAHIESTGRVLKVPSALTASSLSLTASTWYHVYLYDNSGTAAIEVVTTAPATAYFGTARSKTGASTHRYIGSLRATATDTVPRFQHEPVSNMFMYRDAANTTIYRVLSGGTATTSTAVDCSAVVSTTAVYILIKASNTDTGVTFVVGSGADTQESTATSGFISIAPSVRSVTLVPCSSSQGLAYDYQAPAPSVGGAFIDVVGYQYSR